MVIPNPTLRWFLIRSAKFVIDPLSCFTLSSDSSDQIFECGAAKTLYIRSKTVNISARSDFDNLRASNLMNSAGCRYDSNSPAIKFHILVLRWTAQNGRRFFCTLSILPYDRRKLLAFSLLIVIGVHCRGIDQKGGDVNTINPLLGVSSSQSM